MQSVESSVVPVADSEFQRDPSYGSIATKENSVWPLLIRQAINTLQFVRRGHVLKEQPTNLQSIKRRVTLTIVSLVLPRVADSEIPTLACRLSQGICKITLVEKPWDVLAAFRKHLD